MSATAVATMTAAAEAVAEERQRLRQEERPTAARQVAEGLREELEDWATDPGHFRALVYTLQRAVYSSIQAIAPWRPKLQRALRDTEWDRLADNLNCSFIVTRNDQLDRLLALLAYVEKLVADGYLGFMIYQEAEVAAYCYYLRKIRTPWYSFLGLQLGGETNRLLDYWAPEGLITSYRITRRFSARVERVTEQHVHHLQEMKKVPFSDYTGTIPRRYQPLLKVIPQWLAPRLEVVTGTIVEEEIHQRDLHTEQMRSLVFETRKDSPAICWGQLVLAGWSSDDL